MVLRRGLQPRGRRRDKMSRWMCEATWEGNIKNDYVRSSRSGEYIKAKWWKDDFKSGLAENRHETTGEKRKSWRSRTRWMDAVNRDLEMVRQERKMADGGIRWRRTVDDHCGDPRWRDKSEEEKKIVWNELLLLLYDNYVRVYCHLWFHDTRWLLIRCFSAIQLAPQRNWYDGLI